MENINLIGAEQVANAARAMQSAATDMLRAASQIDSSLYIHRQWMDDYFLRLSNLLQPTTCSMADLPPTIRKMIEPRSTDETTT